MYLPVRKNEFKFPLGTKFLPVTEESVRRRFGSG